MSIHCPPASVTGPSPGTGQAAGKCPHPSGQWELPPYSCYPVPLYPARALAHSGSDDFTFEEIPWIVFIIGLRREMGSASLPSQREVFPSVLSPSTCRTPQPRSVGRRWSPGILRDSGSSCILRPEEAAGQRPGDLRLEDSPWPCSRAGEQNPGKQNPEATSGVRAGGPRSPASP